MRLLTLAGTLLIVINCAAETATSKLLSELNSKREMLPGLHQEFDVTQTTKNQQTSQSSRRELIVDMDHKQWRERSVSGSGTRIRIFDGQDLLVMEADGDEYVRTKLKPKDEPPSPFPYGQTDLDWGKAKELFRKSCGFKGVDHTCLFVDVPVKRWNRIVNNREHFLLSGVTRLMIDSETGLLVESHRQEVIENQRGGYQFNLRYSLKNMTFGAAPPSDFFTIPNQGMREVKNLTPWRLDRIRKQLVGKAAPELDVMDISGNSLLLSSLKGKTVLLDFWTTWCPPCVADGPALEKLYRKYADKNFAIVGISVSEDRQIVEKFLSKTPHSFPIVLTTENEMPRPYQIGVFPTYMVIAPDGTLSSAAEGDQGFKDLNKMLEKAGLRLD